MSGGSLDYVFGRIDDAIDIIKVRATRPEHKAFARHLAKVSEALHDLEWVFSSDYGDGREIPAIMAVINHADLIAVSTEQLRDAIRDAEAVLSMLETERGNAD